MKLTSMRTTTLKASAAVIFALPSLVGLPLLLLSGCSSEPAKTTTQQAAVKEPEYLTGHVAFQKMYVASRGWARDAQGFRLASVQSKDSQGHDGKSGIWTAAFASGTLHSSKPYIWSGSSADWNRDFNCAGRLHMIDPRYFKLVHIGGLDFRAACAEAEPEFDFSVCEWAVDSR